jgi:hypothetical protein
MVMGRMLWCAAAVLWVGAGMPVLAEDAVRINPTDPQPTRIMCPGTYVPAAKVTPLKSTAQSQEYLSKPARRGE